MPTLPISLPVLDALRQTRAFYIEMCRRHGVARAGATAALPRYAGLARYAEEGRHGDPLLTHGHGPARRELDFAERDAGAFFTPSTTWYQCA